MAETTKRPRKKAAPGKPLTTIKFKDSSGGKWEFDGALPMQAVSSIIMLATTDGRTTCANVGHDEAIDAAMLAARRVG